MGVVTQDLWRPPGLDTSWEAQEQEPRAAAGESGAPRA